MKVKKAGTVVAGDLVRGGGGDKVVQSVETLEDGVTVVLTLDGGEKVISGVEGDVFVARPKPRKKKPAQGAGDVE